MPSGRPRPARRVRPAVERLEGRTVPTVTYHGGAILPHVEVEALFLGSAWQTDPSLAALPGQLGGFLQSVTQSSFMDQLTRPYGVGRGSYVGGGIDPLPLGFDVNDWQIQDAIAQSIAAGTVPPADVNRVYVVYVAPGVAVHSEFGDSPFGLLGYHSDFRGPAGAGVPYAVLPYPDGANTTIPLLSPFETLTAVTSHELAESATDPFGVNVGRPAWLDATYRDPVTGARGAEIADITEGVFVNLNGYLVQAVVNRQRHVLIPAGGVVDPRSYGLPHRARSAHHAPRADGLAGAAWNVLGALAPVPAGPAK